MQMLSMAGGERLLSSKRDDPTRLRLYIDAETTDERVADAINEIAIDAVDLSEGFEERIRIVVREEVEDHGS
jgi:hypothetical protein